MGGAGGLHDKELAINVVLILPWSLSDLLAFGPIRFAESEDDTRRRWAVGGGGVVLWDD